MRGLILGLSISLLLMGGCAVYDRRLEVNTVTRLRPGETGRKEVERILGQPREVLALTDGALTRHYFHGFQPSRDASRHHRKWEPGELLFRTVTLRYDDKQTLVRKLHDESITPLFRTNDWLFAGPSLKGAREFVTQGVTTGAELIRRLGEPTSRTLDTNGMTQLMWVSAQVRQKRAWDRPFTETLIAVIDDAGVVREFALSKNLPIAFEAFSRR